MNNVEKLIARVRALDAAATPGPWEAKREEGDRETYPYWGVAAVDRWVFFGDNMYQINSTNDSIAAAEYRTLAPKLAAMLERAMEELEDVRVSSSFRIRQDAADAIEEIEEMVQ